MSSSECSPEDRGRRAEQKRRRPTGTNGRVQQSNFNNYRVLRINEAPSIEVHLVRNGEAPGGIGEPGTAVTAPAVANAVFAVTGQRIRKLPIVSQLRTA